MTQNESRILIIGCDYSLIRAYWRVKSPDWVICGFVYPLAEIPPLKFVKGKHGERLPVYPVHELELAIQEERVQKCIIQVSNIPMPRVQSFVHRIVATGRCEVEFMSPNDLSIKCFKPIIVVNSLSPGLGKSQIARYLTSELSSANKKVSVILPIEDIAPHSDVFDVDQGPHFEIRKKADIPRHVYNSTICHTFELLLAAKAECIYATSDTRRAIICAEQTSDIVIYDCQGCDLSYALTNDRYCIVSYSAINNIRKKSFWPGLFNLFDAPIIIDVEYLKELSEKKASKLKDKYFKGRKFFQTISRYEGPQFVRISSKPQFFGISRSVSLARKSEFQEEDFYSRSLRSPSTEFLSQTVSQTDSEQEEQNSNDSSSPPILSDEIKLITGEETVIKSDASPGGLDDIGGLLRQQIKTQFMQSAAPTLRKHFEAQVDILNAMYQASDQEITVSNHESDNRGAFCRLFLESHLPAGFRVTNGEIVDSLSNRTGKLDIIVVNNDCPRMTIESSGSVITPILADSVLAVVDVKSNLTIEAVKRTLSRLRKVKALMPLHTSLEDSKGAIQEDPLHGKILTGIFAFKPNSDVEQRVTEVLDLYPGVIDFIVVPDGFAYFSNLVLNVCRMHVGDPNNTTGYAKLTSKGSGLAMIYGTMNSLAAMRRFSGSSYINYLRGNWGKWSDQIARIKFDTKRGLEPIQRIINAQGTDEQKETLNEIISNMEELEVHDDEDLFARYPEAEETD